MIGIPFGVFSAIRHDTYVDRTLMVISISVAVPSFFLGIMLILFFAVAELATVRRFCSRSPKTRLSTSRA